MVKAHEVEVKPFLLADFTSKKEIAINMKKVTKKELKNLAEGLGMKYTDEQITFTKKLIMAYHNSNK